MRLTYITGFYESYLKSFYAENPKLASEPYATQIRRLQDDAFGWVGAWSDALPAIGYEVQEIYPGIAPLDDAWVAEKRLPQDDQPNSIEIAIQQAKEFRPEVVLFDYGDPVLLRALTESVPSIRLVLGWEGSALARQEIWKDLDVVMSCAPESVDTLKAAGINAEHLDHAFSARILSALSPAAEMYDISFFGQIVRSSDIHRQRERLLEALTESDLPLAILSPSAAYTWRYKVVTVVKMVVFLVHQGLRRAGLPYQMRNWLPFATYGEIGVPFPVMPVSRRLSGRVAPAKFGVAMYQALRDSKVTLNMHADSSPKFASNARLFEVTGVGTCLLTDAKANLKTLFEPEKEVVTYSSVAECKEKARWLLDHPAERRAIAEAGQRKALSQHTFLQRAPVLDQIIRRHLS